jgi:phosphate transport system substrate-binding protein
MGPPSTSGTRDAFVELMLEPGCLEAMPEAKAMQMGGDPARFDAACRRIRSDGAYVEKGEDDTRIVKGLESDPNALGLVGYSYLEENPSRLVGVPIDGVVPNYEAIASGKYPGVRSLYLYVKKKRLTEGSALQAFLNLYASMWNPGGPLAKHGLIALPDNARKRSAETIQLGEPLDMSALP